MTPTPRGEQGAAAVEFALVLPMLLLLVLGIADFGLAYQARVELTAAAAEGVRDWALNPVATQATAEQRTREAAVTLEDDDPATKEVTTVATTCTTGQPTSLTATYQFNYLTPLPGLVAALPGDYSLENPLTFTQTGTMVCSR